MKSKWAWTCVLTIAMLAGCAEEPAQGPEAGRALLDEVADSMGGWEALSAIERQEFITQGNDFAPLQAPEPGVVLQSNGFGQTTLIDYNGPAVRVEFDAERTYPGPAPVVFTEVIEGDVGALLGADEEGNPTARRMQGSRVAARLRDFNRLPRQLPFTARDAADLTRSEDRVIDGQTYRVLHYTDGANPVEVLVDSFTSLPARVIYTETDPLLGDYLNEITYLDWRDTQVPTGAEELLTARMPFGQRITMNGDTLREEAYRNVINNGTFPDGAMNIPQDVRDADEPGQRIVGQWTLRRAHMGLAGQAWGDPEPNVQTDELAPGILHIRGGSHHSLAVEMADHIVVVEAPLLEERSQAVIQAIEQSFPGKPVRYVVSTHFHFDHSGGIRTYAANGATVVVHESIVPFITSVLENPSTIRPDMLTESGVTPTVEGVAETMDLTDGVRTVQVWHVPNEHATGMLMAYIPSERLAFVSDLYSPPAPPQPENANARAFYDAVVNNGLDVDRVVGGHGGPAGSFQVLADVFGE
jgi:glyoxylase-like metal-dependent hydrolase (beta-lactamase superfamily II)